MRAAAPVLLLVLLLAPRAGGMARDPAGREAFEFQLWNRTYEGLAPRIAPLEQGPLRLRLSSPRQTLRLRRHRLELWRAAAGGHGARLHLDFEGQGELVGEVELYGLRGSLRDEVLVPPQERVIEGRVRLERTEEGYRLIPLELPERIEVEIQSQLGARLVDLCRQLSFFPGTDCSGMEQSLSSVSVPLPPPGRPHLLPDDSLSPAERQALDAYLAVAAAR